MPRRNLAILMVVSVVSLLCYHQARTNRYAQVLGDAMDTIERRYVEQVDSEDLFEGAMDGMVRRLDDPYSNFIGQKDLQEFYENIDQEFAGVGMEVSLDPKTKQLTVMSPLFGTPAYKAGIRAGDKILRIGGESTQGLSLKDAVGRMRGAPGSAVTLTILHEDEQEPIELEIHREVIQVDTVVGDTRNGDGSWNYVLEGDDRIGYVRITSFAEKTAGDLQTVLEQLSHEGMEGLILDLRNNPGGLLDAAVNVCDLFISSGTIVTTRDRNGRVFNAWDAHGNGSFDGFPMAVLVNSQSASASEIVAACLQDHGRAKIVGERTWGKGTVQDVIRLAGDRGVLKLTTASYWRPSGKNIHRTKKSEEEDEWGVRPNEGFEVVVEGDELAQLFIWRRDRDNPRANGAEDEEEGDPFVDRQLEKAVEYILQQIDQRKVASGKAAA